MKTILSSFICVLILTLSSFAVPDDPPSGIRLLEIGEFHGDEVTARTGERWLGLYVSGKKSDLLYSTVTVEKVNDPVVDEDPMLKTGKKVSVKRSPEPVFLIRGANMLRPGSVTTIFVGRRPLTNSTTIDLKLSGVEYNLRVVTRDRSSTEAISLDDAELIFSEAGENQTLYALGGIGRETEAWWNLLWAGDLDGDNKLDLYVEVSSHYNVSLHKLFISSTATRGQLLREIAEFRTVGC